MEVTAGATAHQTTPGAVSRRDAASSTERRSSIDGSDHSSGPELEAITGESATVPTDGGGKKRKLSPAKVMDLSDRGLNVMVAADGLMWVLLNTVLENLVNGTPIRAKREEISAACAVVIGTWTYLTDYCKTTRFFATRCGHDAVSKADTKEASTDTDLTPHWWAPSTDDAKDTRMVALDRPHARTPATRRQATANQTPATKTYAAAVGRFTSPDPTDDGSEAGYVTVTGRRRRPAPAPGPRVRDRPRPPKPPAVLIRVAEGKTFDGTLRDVRSAVDPDELGIGVRKLSKTQGGHLLVEIKGGPKAAALAKAVAEKEIGSTGEVVQLGTSQEVEVVGLDPCVVEAEVQAALEAAIATTEDPENKTTRSHVTMTGFWRLRDGSMITTARIPLRATGLVALRVGWTVAKIRPRRPEPIRCHRCLGFGHPATRCEGPDLTGRCRKCGGSGHKERDCSIEDKCVAYDRLGLAYEPHRSGSSGCLAKRKATVKQEGRSL